MSRGKRAGASTIQLALPIGLCAAVGWQFPDEGMAKLLTPGAPLTGMS
ncbi:MAG: hypothetical protein GXP25_19290 [Planctomycetes bacterium]|nr:hypothetical protein [Planctomycetota bacterium]